MKTQIMNGIVQNFILEKCALNLDVINRQGQNGVNIGVRFTMLIGFAELTTSLNLY
jgi:hypothetical protein